MNDNPFFQRASSVAAIKCRQTAVRLNGAQDKILRQYAVRRGQSLQAVIFDGLCVTIPEMLTAGESLAPESTSNTVPSSEKTHVLTAEGGTFINLIRHLRPEDKNTVLASLSATLADYQKAEIT